MPTQRYAFFRLRRRKSEFGLLMSGTPVTPFIMHRFDGILLGPLDVGALERSFNEMARRHEILRATFARVKHEPVQIIAPTLAVHVPIVDLRSIPEQERTQEMERLCTEEATRSFDLRKGPLIRVGLLWMADQRHVLMLTLHHIICDGWSVGLIMEELEKLYCALVAGQPSPLPELPIQFGDYVVWRKNRIGNEAIRAELAYWKKQLAGYRRLEVKADFPKTGERATRSGIVSVLLPRSLSDGLKNLSNRQGGTLFITALAALVALLRRYTGKTDIAIGSPLAGRTQPELESLIGLFVNHVIFRVDMPRDPTFSELEKLVRETALEAFANQDVPFERVVAAIPALAEGDDALFYPINFICQKEYARASTFVFEFSGIHMTTMPSKSQGALYELNFFMVERADGWRLSLEYNSDLFQATTAHGMLEDFRAMLEGAAADPAKRISELPLTIAAS